MTKGMIFGRLPLCILFNYARVFPQDSKAEVGFFSLGVFPNNFLVAVLQLMIGLDVPILDKL